MWNDYTMTKPENHEQNYLVTVALGSKRFVEVMHWTYFDDYFDPEDNHWGWGFWDSYNDCMDESENVIAWMPLPEAFTKES